MQEIKRIFWKYKIQIVLILFLILILSKITYHSDTINAARFTEIIVKSGFSLTNKLATGEIAYPSFFPPTFHFIDSVMYYLFAKIGIYNFNLNNIPFNQLLFVSFLLKLRYLILFILSLFLIVEISNNYEKDVKQRSKIFLLWLLCPVLIFIPFSWGNNDIYPVFLLLLFLLFSFKKKYFLAMLFLGLSAATKNFSLFLIIPVALILADKNTKKTLEYCFISFLIYLIPSILFFKIFDNVFTGGGEGLWIIQRTIFDGPLLFPLVYFLTILFILLKVKITDLNKNIVLVKYCFLILSLFYLTSIFQPHWFLWIMPFFVLTAYKNKKYFYLYLIINITFFVYIYTWSRNIDMNLFSIAFPIINKVMTLSEFVSKFLPTYKIFDIIFSLFFASFVCYIYMLFFDKNKNLTKESLSEKEINIFSLFPLFLYLIISLVFVFGMVKIRNIKNRDWYDLGLSSRNDFLKPINGSNQFYQTFISPNNNLKGLNLFLSSYSKKITTPYKLVLYDETCKNKILESNIEISKIVDYTYREVLFNEIRDSKDKEYCFTVEPTLKKVETPITISYSKHDSYNFGELIIDNKEVNGEDVVFQLIYSIK